MNVGKRRSIIKKSRKREERAAEEICGQRVPGSGSGVAKGDARNSKWYVDDKMILRGSRFTISQEVMDKALGQAHRSGRNPVLRVGLPKYNIAILTWDDFLELINDNAECSIDS